MKVAQRLYLLPLFTGLLCRRWLMINETHSFIGRAQRILVHESPFRTSSCLLLMLLIKINAARVTTMSCIRQTGNGRRRRLLCRRVHITSRLFARGLSKNDAAV